MPTPARRFWSLSEAPAEIVAAAPDGYAEAGCVALSYGGTPISEGYNGTPVDMPPEEWLEALPDLLGLTAEAAATLVVRRATAFLWTAYWHPKGQVQAAVPKVPLVLQFPAPPDDPEPAPVEQSPLVQEFNPPPSE